MVASIPKDHGYASVDTELYKLEKDKEQASGVHILAEAVLQDLEGHHAQCAGEPSGSLVGQDSEGYSQ
jgi:hypothetical protein